MSDHADGSAAATDEQVRTADVIASLCLAIDLGMGFPFEHGLRATMTTMRLCDAMGVDIDTARETYYASLLMYAGCTVDADVRSELFGDSLTRHHTHRQFGTRLESLRGIAGALPPPGASPARRAYEVVTGLPRAFRFAPAHFAAFCEVAGMLAERLGMPGSVVELFPFLSERWDGASLLRRASGEEVPLPLRITHVGRDATYQRLMGDDRHVVDTIRSRSGGAFDPDIVDVFLADADDILAPLPTEGSVWDAVLDAEPGPRLVLGPGEVDRAVRAMGAFADTASPHLAGHSDAVGDLAARAAEVLGMGDEDVIDIRRAGHLHDLGRVAVDPRVWATPKPLTADEWEQVRLHPYHTERVLVRSRFLGAYAPIASAHHERLDGSGYHRGTAAAGLSRRARLLAATDAFRCKVEPRAHRPAMSEAAATDQLAAAVEAGELDAEAVAAVARAAHQEPPDIRRPDGLTDREVDVLRLLARGAATKQIGADLGIATKTADRHIQNIYAKVGVSSRAAATLYAVEQGLVR